MGIDFAGYNPGQGQDTGSTYEDMEDTDEGFMDDANTGWTGYSRPSTPSFGTDFYGGGVTSPTGPNTGPPGSGPGTDFWGGGVTAPMGPNTGPPGQGYQGGGDPAMMGANQAMANEMAAAAQQAQAMAALENWGGGMGFLGGGAEGGGGQTEAEIAAEVADDSDGGFY